MLDEQYILARFYTRRSLPHYASQARILTEHLWRTHICGNNKVFLCQNPFTGVEEIEITEVLLQQFFKDLEDGKIESFSLFCRELAAPPEHVFPFFLRFDSETHWATYTKYESYVEGFELGPTFPEAPGGYCVEISLHAGVFEEDEVNENRFLTICKKLFEEAAGIYGYISVGDSAAVFQRASGLEVDLETFRSLKEMPWIDQYDRRVAGIFWANFLGNAQARQVAYSQLPPEGWDVVGLRSSGLLVRACQPLLNNELDTDALVPFLGSLLPQLRYQVRPLPSKLRSAALFDQRGVEHLGGIEFIQKYLPAQDVQVLDDGSAIAVVELVNEFDDYLLNQFLRPLRPAKCGLWEIQLPEWSVSHFKVVGPMDAPMTSFVRVRISSEQILDQRGIPFLVLFAGRSSRKSLEDVVERLKEWVHRTGGTTLEIETDRRCLRGRMRIPNLDVKHILQAVDTICSVGKRKKDAFLFCIGSLRSEEIRLLERSLTSGSFYVYL